MLGQGHGDAHPYILQVCTVASLSSPLRGPQRVQAAHMKSSLKRSLAKRETLEWKLVLLVLLVLLELFFFASQT